MPLPESQCNAELFCRSAALPCPSGTSEESQKAKVKTQKSKGRFALQLLYGKCRREVGGSLVKMFTQAVLFPVEFLENFWI
jgi:hypothetical protein